MKFGFLKDMRKVDILTLSVFSLGAHSGTHTDAPMHCVVTGVPVDQAALDPLIGAARVIDIADSVRADAAELNRHDWRSAQRVLFRTRSTLRGWMDSPEFHRDFAYIAPDAAQLLADAGVLLVGVDYISAEQFGAPAPVTHQILLGRGIPIVEGMDQIIGHCLGTGPRRTIPAVPSLIRDVPAAVSLCLLLSFTLLHRLPAQQVPSLPEPVTNNAIAAGGSPDGWTIYSVLGVDSTKRWSGITRRAHRWTAGAASWTALPPVPGPVGRLAASAAVVRGKLVVVGGYSVDSTGAERSLDAVDIFDPVTAQWRSGAPIPVPIDDAVAGVYHDSLLYIVSGWHDTDNVPNVQVYDPVQDRWAQATPFPGTAVFGGSGTLAGNTLVLIDGARRSSSGPRYVIASQSWAGTIDPAEPTHIDWRPVDGHLGLPRYRAAAAPCGDLVLIAGGTDNPYNYDGVGYDRRPSGPLAMVIAFDARSRSWRTMPDAPTATMDHRALAIDGVRAHLVGGMRAGQIVAADVVSWAVDPCPP